ncbi:PNPOx family protein [Williamsia deligens]|uniref:Pyridoxamine 5'-phosphate oxidase family protein n=1 Tax=Williamsia deligens TaxID=321325 RepID=A0ABW3G2B6_9NOCA|nr:pyridoxamine 5'-phosphate oxidase family protein [Williamsia deligens]MCP2194963.1 Pyridoxamine 5'-phosphate oxidase [Williamsia deligens]
MRSTTDEAHARIVRGTHGVLCTLHPERGPDPLPVVYAAVDGLVGIPVDTVKAKTTGRLRREDNLETDRRAALLVVHWDRDDWTRLWWARAHLEHVAEPAPSVIEELSARLEATVPQYVGRPFRRVLVLRIVSVSGWSASG